MTETPLVAQSAPLISLGIFAWNEEKVIRKTLTSLFQQTLFHELRTRGRLVEVICVVNGCEDRTPEIAADVFQRQSEDHPDRDAFVCRVVRIVERGKLNAWNRFVHTLSHSQATYLVMMDADILFQDPRTIAQMLSVLENQPEAHVAVDRPVKDLGAKLLPAWRQKLATGAAQITQASPAQLCAQLYCIRSPVARNIYLPRDLAACEDGFIKAIVCTDFLTKPLNPGRIQMAPQAAHSFEAYTSPQAILKNQKRQIIGQTVVHILVDQYLTSLPMKRRLQLAQTLQRKENTDPTWLKRLIDEHLRRVKYFWKLYPDLLTLRLRRLRLLQPQKRLACFPAALASTLVALVSSLLAYRFLKSGSTNYWPSARGSGSTRPSPAIASKPNAAIHNLT